jgi:uncharacterized protein
MIVLHHNDADGRCAAAIVRKWAKEQKRQESRIIFCEMDYKMNCPLDDIQKDDTVVIVDFSFKPDIMKQIQDKTSIGVIWCDHHATAKDYGYEVAGERDFTDKGLSGCELTWKFFFPDKTLPEAVFLIGDYDSWRLKTAPKCYQFYEGLKLEDQSPESPLWQESLVGINVHRILQNGKVVMTYRDNYCSEMRKAFGFETEIGGVKAFATNIYRFGSPGFGEDFNKYPICIAYAHDGKKFTVNLYSETVDVSVIAKQFGGGGHKGASGFICETLPFRRV